MTKCKCGCGLDAITSEIPYEYKGTEVGTMKEVRPEYGDTVAARWKGNDVWGEYTYVEHHPRYGFECFLCNKDRISFIMPEDEHLWSWRIISRATTSPVRTVTTTRQEIVSGEYGAVSVSVAGGVVCLCLIDQADVTQDPWHVALSAEDLTAAITTLTSIRDAMQANDRS